MKTPCRRVCYWAAVARCLRGSPRRAPGAPCLRGGRAGRGFSAAKARGRGSPAEPHKPTPSAWPPPPERPKARRHDAAGHVLCLRKPAQSRSTSARANCAVPAATVASPDIADASSSAACAGGGVAFEAARPAHHAFGARRRGARRYGNGVAPGVRRAAQRAQLPQSARARWGRTSASRVTASCHSAVRVSRLRSFFSPAPRQGRASVTLSWVRLREDKDDAGGERQETWGSKRAILLLRVASQLVQVKHGGVRRRHAAATRSAAGGSVSGARG